jgi:hypothetical protein
MLTTATPDAQLLSMPSSAATQAGPIADAVGTAITGTHQAETTLAAPLHPGDDDDDLR